MGSGHTAKREWAATSPAMRRLLELAARAAPTEANVLITGESGTGKERLARFVHARSRRNAGPFIAINCGALPDTLLESELFGYTKGAFTGAHTDKQGLFQAAAGGTLFLDEIGETSLAMQVRLLRALQERVVRPVGATRDEPIDVRIVAATNRALENMVAAGDFREDLYYRLRVIHLVVPPLRKRREDIPVLARELIARTCMENRCGPCSLSPAALDALEAYAWPGNVRELENAIERAVALAEGKPHIGLTDLPPEVRGEVRGPIPAPLWNEDDILPLAEIERRYILATLDRLGGNRKATAKALGIGENTLWRRLKRYGLVRKRRRADQRPESKP